MNIAKFLRTPFYRTPPVTASLNASLRKSDHDEAVVQRCFVKRLTQVKKRRHRCFPMNFAKFLTTPFFRTSPVAAPNRSRRPEVFCKNGALRNFVKITGKHLFQGLFFNKVLRSVVLWIP